MNQVKVNCALFSALLLWASAFLGIKYALTSYSPGAMALLRFIVASLCMAILYHKQKDKPKISWKDSIQLMITGMAGIGVYNLCLNYGELTVSAGIASFIIGLMPIFTVILSILFLREKTNSSTWLGIGLSMIGLFLLVLGEGQGHGVTQGLFFILISALVGAMQTIVKKRFLQKYSAISVISWVLWGGTFFLLFFTKELTNEIAHASSQATLVVVYMGIFPAAIAYFAWTYALKKIPAHKASTSMYTLPFISTILAVLILGEHPSVLSLVGGGIALLGALVAHRVQIGTSKSASSQTAVQCS